jgi:hypothetical protein
MFIPFNCFPPVVDLLLKYLPIQQNIENDHSLELVTREARIFRNLLTLITMQFLIGTIEQALLTATFRLWAAQWM